MKNILIKTAHTLLLILIASCTTEDLNPTLEQDNAVEDSINTIDDLKGVLRGAYAGMTAAGYYGRDFIIDNEVRTDNVFANGHSSRFVSTASFLLMSGSNAGVWRIAYQVIARANIVIGTDLSTLTGDAAYARHLQGQAYAIRALAHFDLLRNYGQQHVDVDGDPLGVPYITEFLGDNLLPARNTVDENRVMILQDLRTAFELMQDDYFDASKEFMSKYTAKALESKVAIYFGLWEEAKAAAKAVINTGLYTIIPADQYVASFSEDGSLNSIFELAFSDLDRLAFNSLGFIYKGDVYGDIQVLPNVEPLYEAGDVRADILGYEGNKLRNLGKYPDLLGSDNVPVIRYEEVLLNYAEALFETGGDALTELNKLTALRGASAYMAPITKDDILNERRKELIFEGFRYDDLLRTGRGIEKVDFEQNILESIPYGDPRLAFPIPQFEIEANSNMIQNTGY
ncbi:MAG: RagB/SusD family nutrient uptake outer membrane protein [Bacteroidetes bacterium]|nr:MAG: RagB/SusD family nutrient uptake outer membrane protein [Bacteroidota bacterium]